MDYKNLMRGAVLIGAGVLAACQQQYETKFKSGMTDNYFVQIDESRRMEHGMPAGPQVLTYRLKPRDPTKQFASIQAIDVGADGFNSSEDSISAMDMNGSTCRWNGSTKVPICGERTLEDVTTELAKANRAAR